jgi:glycosyltransferase involved in cell wall biosynthesis
MNPLVSVVVPVYNAEKYLPEALSDLLNQTMQEVEFIFVDDGSTDSSLEILQNEAKKDSRIRILHQEHKFAGCARNLGMEAAKGKYFIALDADDRFERNLLDLAVHRAEETNAEIVVFDADRLIMSLNKFIPDPVFLITKDLPTKNFCPNEVNEAVFRVMVTWNKLYKLSWLKENNFTYQDIYECNDVLFTFLTLACSKNVVALPKVLVHYRRGEKFNIQSNKDLHPLDGGRALLSLKGELISRGIFTEFKNH